MTSISSLAALSDNFFIELSDYSVVSVTGEDAADYLHGQLTVNTKSFDHQSARWSAHCDFKGKTWAVQLIQSNPSGFVLSANASANEASLEQLQKYGVFSKVTFTTTAQKQCIVRGPWVTQFMTQIFGGIPSTEGQSLSKGSDFCCELPGLAGHYLLILGDDNYSALIADAKSNNVDEYDSVVFEALSIRAGLPSVAFDTVNQFVPQMMNLQALNAIDFDKGCYMGQEVVARTRYLGKNKRAAYPLVTNHYVKCTIGATIDKQVGDNWRKGGTVLREASLTNETWLLAVLANDTQTGDELRLGEDQPTIFKTLDIPYSIE